MSVHDSSIAPQAMRDMTLPERLAEVSKELGSRAQQMADAATRVVHMREELSSAQQHYDQTAASFRDARIELEKLLDSAGVGEMTTAKAY